MIKRVAYLVDMTTIRVLDLTAYFQTKTRTMSQCQGVIKRVAYLVDMTTIRVLDLAGNQELAQFTHDSKVSF